MKKILVVGLILLLLGCSHVQIEKNNEIDDNKSSYLAIKKALDNTEEYTNYEDLPCNVNFSVNKITDEEISYRTIIDSPKKDMYKVKALLIHDYFTEDIFPSIGIFDDTLDLIVDNEEVKGISLVGYIKTTKQVEELDLKMKLYIQYEDIEGTVKEVYYKLEQEKEDIGNL